MNIITTLLLDIILKSIPSNIMQSILGNIMNKYSINYN
jgi:hypothetical protein